MHQKIKILHQNLLYKGWSSLHEYHVDYRFNDGNKSILKREIYNSGDGAAVLLYNPIQRTILLVKQFRLAALLNGHATGFLVESCAGMLDKQEPEKAIVKEIEEETGFRVSQVSKIGEVYATPGAHMEKIHLYVAEYHKSQQVNMGGGMEDEHEEIEILEYTFSEATKMVKNGFIEDAKTLILLQYGIIHGLIY